MAVRRRPGPTGGGCPLNVVDLPIFEEAVLWLATGFGAGVLLPAAVAASLGYPLALLLTRLPLPRQLGAILVLILAAAAICDRAETTMSRRDDRRIVADEYMTFPLAVVGLPGKPGLLAAAWVVSRSMDVLKPPPARQAERLAGGLGIVADDVVANLYALAINALIGLKYSRRD